jgi:hypothetical protein
MHRWVCVSRWGVRMGIETCVSAICKERGCDAARWRSGGAHVARLAPLIGGAATRLGNQPLERASTNIAAPIDKAAVAPAQGPYAPSRSLAAAARSSRRRRSLLFFISTIAAYAPPPSPIQLLARLHDPSTGTSFLRRRRPISLNVDSTGLVRFYTLWRPKRPGQPLAARTPRASSPT